MINLLNGLHFIFQNYYIGISVDTIGSLQVRLKHTYARGLIETWEKGQVDTAVLKRGMVYIMTL